MIRLLIAFFVVLGVLYSLVTPIFEASDELWHYPMVKQIADHWALPVQDPENPGPWRQEGSQPPLYYTIAALLTFWIDTGPMEAVWEPNPHGNYGEAAPDGNVNLVVHRPDEGWPWRGVALAVHLIRFLSVAMGAATVYLTYRLVLTLWPDREELALATAAVTGFTPMFLFISASVNNDNLVVLLSTLALVQMARLVQPALSPSATRSVCPYLALGTVLGLAVLTKESALGLLPLAALALLLRGYREMDRPPTAKAIKEAGGRVLRRLALVALPVLLIAGWWYGRNWRLYGDPLGLNAFIAVLGQRDVPADLAQLWRERYSFLAGYWGNFGGLNIPLPEPLYTLFNGLLLLAVLGLFKAGWAKRLPNRRRPTADHGPGTEDRGLYPAGTIVFLWPAIVFVSWIRWATVTWSSQGRLVFSAIAVWSLLLVLGITAWFPARHRRWVLGAVGGLMGLVSALAPLVWIAPAYRPPPPLTEAQVAAIPHRLDVTFFHPAGGQLRLLGYAVEADRPLQPGEKLPVTLYWEAVQPFGANYSVFLHLVNEDDLVIAQREGYPGMGLLPTRWLEPGRRWAEQRIIPIPETAYTPDTLTFTVGMYDFTTGERLAAVDRAGREIGDHVRFGQVRLEPPPGASLPNPLRVNFDDQMALVGYQMSRRAVHPGETVTVTLYWEALRPMSVNYAISAQIVNEAQVKAAQKDSWPQDGAAPTSTWQPGQVVEDPRPLTIAPEAAPGVYRLRVAVYRVDEAGELHLLPIIPTGGRLQTDHLLLTPVRVYGR